MASIYARRGTTTIYARIKGYEKPGKWWSGKTEYKLGEEENAKRWAARMEERIASRGKHDGPLTLARFVIGEPIGERKNWVERRKALGVRSWHNEESRMRLHILPVLGHMALTEIRSMHVRDLLCSLVESGKLGARTIREVYATLARAFATALGDELGLETSPCQLKARSRELPKRHDVDPEWRPQATYTPNEIERLISDPALPVDARVQYALKSIAMLRHGEVAALRWRHYDPTAEPLGRLNIVAAWDSRNHAEKGTKSGAPRAVPVHPTLAKLLAEWKLTHWARVYGRAATDDDLIVPNLALGHLDGPTCGRRYPRHLRLLGLRERAGRRRNRGGHDLRAWGITSYQTSGAHRDILKLSSHGAGGNVIDGYTRVRWPEQCAEISKLKIERLDGEILALATRVATRSAKQLNYWGKRNLPQGQQTTPMAASDRESAPNQADSHDPGDSTRIDAVARLATELEALAAAVLAGDSKLARKLARQAGRPAMKAV